MWNNIDRSRMGYEKLDEVATQTTTVSSTNSSKLFKHGGLQSLGLDMGSCQPFIFFCHLILPCSLPNKENLFTAQCVICVSVSWFEQGVSQIHKTHYHHQGFYLRDMGVFWSYLVMALVETFFSFDQLSV